MKPEDFKEMVQIKLELLRGCCNTPSIKKSQIAESIQEFIKKIEAIKLKAE